MRLKDFNEYTRDSRLTESIFQKWEEKYKFDIQRLSNSLNESSLFEDYDDDEDEREYTSGEKAALARDFQVFTEEQLAVLYLRAKEREEEEDGKYLNAIDGLDNYVDADVAGEYKITVPALSDAIGMASYISVGRTIRKFRNLISGIGETSGEALYPKILKAYEKFSRMRESDVAIIASGAIETEVNTAARDSYARSYERGRANLAQRKKEDLKIGEMVYGLVKELRRLYPLSKANTMSVNRVAERLEREPKSIKLAYHSYLKSVNQSGDFKF